jgi:mRNA interferase RelE/StbE
MGYHHSPQLIGMLFNCEPLKAEGSYYRVRVNDYRIGFTEDEGVITFIRVLHRREMYRYFP